MSLKFDASRFINREMSSFYSSFPPPPLIHASNHSLYGRMAYLDGELWHDRQGEPRKLYATDKNRNDFFSPFIGTANRSLDKDHTKYLELDLTSTHQQEKPSPSSPSEYYRRRDILSNGSSSHSTSPSSPHLSDQMYIKQKEYSSKEHLQLYSPKNNGIMEKSDQDGVINLSTSPKDVKDNLPNGDIIRNGDTKEETQGSGPHSPQEFTGKHNNNVQLSSSTSSSSTQSAAKRKTKSNSAIELNAAAQPLMMMAAAQHSMMPQQLQHLLQQNQGMTPQQLQQMMQHQSLLLQHQQQQKLQEQALQELNEQLQLNVVQQTQLMQQQQSDKNKSSKAQQQLQQLALQQQQLVQQIQQIQIQQRQFLLASLVQPFGMPQGMMSPSEIQQLWKEVAAQSGLDPDTTHKSNFNGLGSMVPTPPSPAQSIWANGLVDNFPHSGGGLPNHSSVTMETEDKNSIAKQSILYRHGVCKWPGCDTACEDQNAFHKHLNSEHTLDDRSTAQARVQLQVVSQLEIQLSREKDLLQGMMQHLHMKPPESKSETSQQKSVSKVSTPVSPLPFTSHLSVCTPSPPKPTSVITSPIKLQPNMTHHLSVSAPPTPLPIIANQMSLAIPHPIATSLSKPPTSQSQSLSQPSTPTAGGPMRRRVSDKCNLPISAEIQRNRDFYKSTDVRPPFTYASLIRQAIIESPHKQLTLNEIYQWFQNTFAYFRRNEATWKNAVRHNLSLHKCFMRVENVKGAVWTVDEIEFYKRRPQKLGGFEDDFGSFWMVDDLEFVRRRHLTRGRPRKYHECEQTQSTCQFLPKDVKSPSMATDPSLFGENLNASLRAALEQANLLSHQYSNGSITMDGVEDLSMKSSRNSSSGSPKLESPSQEEFPDIKEEMEDDYSKEETCLENGHSPLDAQMNMVVKDDEEHSELLDQSANERPPKAETSLIGQCSPNQDVFSHSLQKQEAVVVSISEPVGS